MKRLLVLAVLIASVLIPATPASAHGVYYGYRSCTYEALQQLQAVTVLVDSSAPFPPPAMHDGVLNSFPARLHDAVSRLNTSIATTGQVPHGIRMAVGNEHAFVGVGYRNIGSSLGTTTRSFNSGLYMACSMHGANRAMIDQTWIDLDIRNDWFTQDDSRRAFWEACWPSGSPSYTCGKNFDAGGVLLHELGHGLGLHHPEEVDSHTGNGTATGPAYGNCASTTANATMCALTFPGRSTTRTFDLWDQETLRRHYVAT